MSPSLTVVLVTRNAMPFVVNAVAQARQVAGEFGAQVVAVDGGSTDGTWQELCRESGWTVLQQQEPGLAAARNEALAAATGDIVAFLDADDTWLPGKTERQLDVLAQEPGTEVVSCGLVRVSASADVAVDAAEAQPQAALTPSGCLFRRSVFARVGGFDTHYRIAADHEWFARARAVGVGIQVVPEVLLHKGVHGANLSHDRSTYRRELAQVFRTVNAATSPGPGR